MLMVICTRSLLLVVGGCERNMEESFYEKESAQNIDKFLFTALWLVVLRISLCFIPSFNY